MCERGKGSENGGRWASDKFPPQTNSWQMRTQWTADSEVPTTHWIFSNGSVTRALYVRGTYGGSNVESWNWQNPKVHLGRMKFRQWHHEVRSYICLYFHEFCKLMFFITDLAREVARLRLKTEWHFQDLILLLEGTRHTVLRSLWTVPSSVHSHSIVPHGWLMPALAWWNTRY